MNFKRKFFSLLCFILIFIFSVLLLLEPTVCKKAVAKAIVLCSSVLIPSLFPYTVCMLFIINSDLVHKSKLLTPITNRIFGLSQYSFLIMLFSFLGGFPIGGKLLNDAVKQGALTQNQGKIMINYCVNAGPAFIVSVVGSGILHSEKLGYILLASHLLSSVAICIFTPKIENQRINEVGIINPIDNFVTAASSAATSIIGICGYVIFFAVISAYLNYYSKHIPFLSTIACFLEITTAVTQTKNIYLISFLLGFSGICIWFQVLSVTKLLEINIIRFALSRCIHGALSVIITYILLKIFPTSLPIFSNLDLIPTPTAIPKSALSIAIVVLGIIFTISLISREKNTKILEDVI